IAEALTDRWNTCGQDGVRGVSSINQRRCGEGAGLEGGIARGGGAGEGRCPGSERNGETGTTSTPAPDCGGLVPPLPGQRVPRAGAVGRGLRPSPRRPLPVSRTARPVSAEQVDDPVGVDDQGVGQSRTETPGPVCPQRKATLAAVPLALL